MILITMNTNHKYDHGAYIHTVITEHRLLNGEQNGENYEKGLPLICT